MTTLTITAKGQVTLKKDVLRHLGAGPGDRVDVALLPEGRVRLSAAGPSGSIDDFIGTLSDPPVPPVSIDEMNRIIADGWAGRLCG